MKRFFLIVTFLFCTTLWCQNDLIAKRYFDDGLFEKALPYYEKLVQQHPGRPDYVLNLVQCYQQLENYKAVEELLLPGINSGSIYPTFIVELGYNYELQKKELKAKTLYEKALDKIDENPNYTDAIGIQFQKHSLLNYAIRAYIKGGENNPLANYDFQLARIYGEKGEIENMYDHYLNLIYINKASLPNVLRYIGQFISEDGNDENNRLLRKLLLQRAQKNPDVLWNELLSWLFIQQKQYASAFVQEKAIYNRAEATSLQRLEDLGDVSLEEGDYATANRVFLFITEKSYDVQQVLKAHLNLISIKLVNPGNKTLEEVHKQYKELLETYGVLPETVALQNEYARFMAFYLNRHEEAIAFLKMGMQLPLNRYDKSKLKMTLADILVYSKRFNEALIYYSQVQKDLKNDVIGQNARFKVAKTSFYKGDFNWASTQLKVLRSSTSQLIANDAMQLSLLISDNSLEDSTQTALKKYAKADLLAYQGKQKEAVNLLEAVLREHKGEKIEDEALFMQAQLLEKEGKYEEAKQNYLKIVEFYPYDILADDALFALAEVYVNHLADQEKAKYFYEKIILEHPDSIYFVEARKKYRRLRGDAIH